MTHIFWSDRTGWFVSHENRKYGPWQGRDGEGYFWDIWSVHDRCVTLLGVCPFDAPCDESHQRPETFAKMREKDRVAFDHHDLPLFAE